MPWEPVILAGRGHPPANPEPQLRVATLRNGWLNVTAREWLFGEGERQGKVRWDEDGERGLLSLVADPNGSTVNRQGYVTATPVTKRADGAPLPVILRLRPVIEDGDGTHRLVLAGVAK